MSHRSKRPAQHKEKEARSKLAGLIASAVGKQVLAGADLPKYIYCHPSAERRVERARDLSGLSLEVRPVPGFPADAIYVTAEESNAYNRSRGKGA